jgi:hypothetical protein
MLIFYWYILCNISSGLLVSFGYRRFAVEQYHEEESNREEDKSSEKEKIICRKCSKMKKTNT